MGSAEKIQTYVANKIKRIYKMFERILFFDDKLNNVLDMNSISNCYSVLIDADIEHPYITTQTTKPYKEYITHDAFFHIETGEYTNRYAEYVFHRRGENEMPTKSLTGVGKIFLINKEGIQFGGGFQNNIDMIYSFVQDSSVSNELKMVIFDWDRTLTSIEGWWPNFFEDVYPLRNSHDSSSTSPAILYESAMKDAAQYLFGGPEREEEIRNMFSNLHKNDIFVMILTNNPTASTILFEEEPEVNTRQVFLDMVNVVYPEFISEHLVSTYQGKSKRILPKSVAYKNFLEANKAHLMTHIGGKRKKRSIILTKKNMRRARRKGGKTKNKHRIKPRRRKTK
jgi:hypothetical protein